MHIFIYHVQILITWWWILLKLVMHLVILLLILKLLCGYCNSANYSRSYSKNYFSQKIRLVTHPNRTRKESDGWTRVTPDCSECWVGWLTHSCNFETLQNATDGLRLCFQKLTLYQKSSKTAMGFYLGPWNNIEIQYCVVYGVCSRWIATIRLGIILYF